MVCVRAIRPTFRNHLPSTHLGLVERGATTTAEDRIRVVSDGNDCMGSSQENGLAGSINFDVVTFRALGPNGLVLPKGLARCTKRFSI